MLPFGRPSLLLAALLALPLLAHAQQPQRKPPCSAPEYRQFDFWLGDWEVKTPDGKLAGTNLVTRPFGDCVIQEHWQGAQGGPGESYNMYDNARGVWHQTWVDAQGTLLLLDGGLVNGDMVLSSAPRTRGGKSLVDRITWHPASAQEVHQVWEQSEDGGKTWKSVFHGIYRPKPAATH